MNINIKFILSLLLLASPILNSTELVIVIPKEYKSSKPPLPPFPSEAMENLDTFNYQNEISNFKVETILQDRIEYNYYPDVLNLNIRNKHALISSGAVSITNSVNSQLSSTVKSNYYGLSLTGSNVLENNKITIDSYFLPIDLGGELYPFSEDFTISADFQNYNQKINISTSYNNDTISGKLDYIGNTFLYTYSSISYNSDIEGALAFGKKNKSRYYLFGASYYLTMLQPYLDLFIGNDFNLEVKSINSDGIDYMLLAGYKNYISLGGFYNLDYNLTPNYPGIIIKSYYGGEKSIELTMDSIKSSFNLNLKSIWLNLKFNIDRDMTIYSSGELKYENWSYGLIYDDYDILAKLSYEVVL